MRSKKQYCSTMRDEYDEIKCIEYHDEINFLNTVTFEMESIIWREEQVRLMKFKILIISGKI